ncbi:MAG TPA: 4-hydroxythreonine-4-phosphate dehydrogenase PdxA, partial [Elusimicrobiales bacterium]|nr:4-hydroxythreonine-4-phosphate dehydrogenase PdxA [Elusimicrobiales bacterium]
GTAYGTVVLHAAPEAAAGLASFKAVERALELLKAGHADALVTAPVSKEAWRLAGIKHTGHTDLFRYAASSEPLMGFSSGRVRTALITEHFPLKRVSSVITKELVIKKALLFSDALKAGGIKRPRITLAALNPHSGDGGLLGMEEIRVLRPAVLKLRAKGLDISGPAPSDAAWREHLAGLSDGLLCTYHDQALTPLKILPGSGRTVHWTWGLPFIRTSPAHGTAFDIAGTGKADPTSMTEAILYAANLAAGNKRKR